MARAAKHSKAVVEEPVPAPSVAAPEASSSAAATAVAAVPVVVEETVVVSETIAVAADRTVSHEEIAKLAYCYWADRGFQGGNPQEDWERAERELLAAL